MLKQTSKILLSQITQHKKYKILNQTSIFSKNNIKHENIDTVNTIKVDFTRMTQSKIHQNLFTQCQCGALLIDQEQFKKSGRQKKQDHIVWYCRFCGKQNLSKQIYFCKNGYKAVLEKNIQRGFLPPILLFLIDISGSMGQSISVQLETTNEKESNLLVASKQILEIIKNSYFQQKQCYKEKQMKQKYRFSEQKEDFLKNKFKGKQYFSNISLFMGIIENYLSKMKHQTQLAEFRIGFVFFNEQIYVMKPTATQKTIPVFISKTSKFKKQFPFNKKVVDFNNFQALFNQGKKQFQRFFGDSRLKTCDLQKLMVQNLNIQGQTALGPALSLALGIVSAHDIGSRIVLVSDAMPNKGILSPQTELQNQKVYNEINKLLELRKITLGVLNWITDTSKSYKQKLKSQFGQFLKSNKERIKQITLDFSLRQGHLDILNTARKTLQNLMSRGSLGQVLSIKVFTSNQKVQATNIKYDDLNFRYTRFLGLQHKSWIQLKLKKITQQDLLFPVYTQLVITYEDIFTKQKYLFMSYAVHKVISTATDKQVYQCLDDSNKNNLNQLLDLQKLYKFDRDNIISQSLASRSFQIASTNSQKMHAIADYTTNMSLNALAELQNRICEQDSDFERL